MNARFITSTNPYKICFVCLGNICRSPTAEGVFQHLVNGEGLEKYFLIDSAGTSSWHIGEPANSRSRGIAEKYGVELHSRGRQFVTADLDEFDLVLAMDEENYRYLFKMASTDEHRKKIKKIREFDPNPDDGNVPDPYYGGTDGFENVYRILCRSSETLLNSLKNQIDE